jgi:hypothetical protein
MNKDRANRVEWEWIDPRRIEDVHDLVTVAHRALESRAASSLGTGQRRAIADRLERVRAQMQELARLAGYEDGSDEAKHAELPHRRLELLPGVKMLDRLPDIADARRQSR